MLKENKPEIGEPELLKLNLVIVEVKKDVDDDYEAAESGDDTTCWPYIHHFHQVLVNELE